MSVPLKISRLIDAAPPSVSDDPWVAAILYAADMQIKEFLVDLVEVLILPRIDELDGPILDILAWQLHVDIWDTSDPVELKRTLLKSSLSWHMRKGTVGLVQEVLDTYFEPGAATLQEWYQYNPSPPNFPLPGWHDRYRFRILVDQDIILPETEETVLDLVLRFKPISRWPEDQAIIRARVSELDSIWWAGASLTWKYHLVEAGLPRP